MISPGGELADPLAVEPLAPERPTADEAGVDLAARFAGLARQLHCDGDPSATLRRIVDAAVTTVPGAEQAAITTVAQLEFSTIAATGQLPIDVDRVQYEMREGPCVDSLMGHETYRSNDLSSDSRFPLFAPEAVRRTGVRSMLSFRLFTEESSLGALNLYSTSVDAFGPDSIAMGAVYAAHASVALRSAGREQVMGEMSEELDAQRDIAMAVGIVMATNGCSEHEARRVLEISSSEVNRSLGEVAAVVVESGEPPQDPLAVSPRGADRGSFTVTGPSPLGTSRAFLARRPRRAEAGLLAGGLLGIVVGVALILEFTATSSQAPVGVLLVPVLAVALAGSVASTATVAVAAVVSGAVLFATGDQIDADMRLRFLALLVGAGLTVVFAGMRGRRETVIRRQAGAVAVASARAATEEILGEMLGRLPELDTAPDVDGVVERACRLGRELFGADHASYWVIDGDDCVLLHREPVGEWPAGLRVPRAAFLSASASTDLSRTAWVIRGASEASPRLPDEQDPAVVGTATAVQVAGVPVAYFAMSWRSPRPEPHASWLDAVDRFADQVALAKTVIRRRAAQRETSDLAQRFQAGMLPRLPSDGPITVHSLYRPGLNQMLLGGDFLDVMSRDDDELAFIVGDVAGHGPEQAALGATLRGAWLALASVPALEIDDWAAALNRVVLQRASGEGLFVTGVMGTVSRSRGTLRYASAGHPPPILLSPDVRTTEAGGPALGLMPGAVYRVHEVALPAQWAVLLVTDGLFEGRLPNSDRLRGNYDDFLERLAERDLVPESAASWLPQFADELERLNGGQLSDDAAAILLLPTPGTGCGAPGVDS